ncbi:MAG TPA: hypothetical protein VHC96_17325, partial [Puia sp.]|nr:hypothetical protein [Puia sp.]
MIPYILHVSILIAAGVLFYKLALKKLTFYVLNRWVLLSCLVSAFLLPLAPMPRVLSWRAVVRQEAAVVTETASVVESVSAPSTAATKAIPAKPKIAI